MPGYQEMYLTMTRESERAIRLLAAAQQACEKLYLSAAEPEPFPPEKAIKKRADVPR